MVEPPNRKVLLVEDDLDFAMSLKILLEMQGCEVTVVNTGEELCRAIPDSEASIVLMDIRLPGMDGIETLEAMRQLGSAATVVLMTGCEQDSDEVTRARQTDAVAILHKPFKVNELLGLVNVNS